MKRLGHLSGAMVLSSALVFQASWTHGQEEKPGKAPAKEAAKEADESDDIPKGPARTWITRPCSALFHETCCSSQGC